MLKSAIVKMQILNELKDTLTFSYQHAYWCIVIVDKQINNLNIHLLLFLYRLLIMLISYNENDRQTCRKHYLLSKESKMVQKYNN